MLNNYQLPTMGNRYIDTAIIDRRIQGILSIFILAVILTTAKGLRLGGDIGLGELLILIFVLSVLLKKTEKISWVLYQINNYFWYTIFSALLIGMSVSYIFYQYDFQFPRTLLAYGLCFAMTIAIFKSRLLENHSLLAVRIYIKAIVYISLIFLVLILLNVNSIAGINLYWMGTTRFQGWSLDPNQFAIVYIVVPFMIIYLVKHTREKLGKFKLFLSFLIVLVPALATESDSLILAWGAGGGIFLIFTLFRLHGDRGITYIKFICLIGLIGLGPIYIYINFHNIKESIADIFFKDGQGITRINIWLDTVEIIKSSPIVGLGPDQGRDINGAIMGEAHNNILQLGVGAGLVGVIAFILYFLFILIHTIKSKNFILLGALVSLFVFGLTHYTLRHPSFWFMLLLIDALAIKKDFPYQKNAKKTLL